MEILDRIFNFVGLGPTETDVSVKPPEVADKTEISRAMIAGSQPTVITMLPNPLSADMVRAIGKFRVAPATIHTGTELQIVPNGPTLAARPLTPLPNTILSFTGNAIPKTVDTKRPVTILPRPSVSTTPAVPVIKPMTGAGAPPVGIMPYAPYNV